MRSSETITNGNPITTFRNELITYNYNVVNQLTSLANPSMAFAYDEDGNMTQGYTPEGYVFTATYDAENRLKSLEYTDGSGIVRKTTYHYSGDSFLAKVEKYENGSLVSDTRFVRDGFLTLQERNASNSVVNEYTWGINMGGGIGGLLNLKQGGLDYAYLYDGKGNVTTLLNSSQAVIATYTYDTFGNLMAKTGTVNQPYQFSTKAYDETTGLSYYGYRFYAPANGRWMTRDPVGEAGGINLYEFVGNNPVNRMDANGLQEQEYLNTLITTAIAVSQVDSPMIGPADIIALGIAVYAITQYRNRGQEAYPGAIRARVKSTNKSCPISKIPSKWRPPEHKKSWLQETLEKLADFLDELF